MIELAPRWKVVIAVGWLFLIGLLTVLGGTDTGGLNLENPAVILLLKVVQAISVILLFILPAILFSIFFSKEKMRFLQLHISPKLSLLLLGGLAFLCALPFISWLESVNQQMSLPGFMSGIEDWMKRSEEALKKVTEAFLADTSVGGLILNLFVIAFLAGLSEEIFFRGVLQKSLQQATGNAHAAVWIAAILFSAFHMQFYGFIPRMLMGAVLGYLYLWSGSLWVSIFAHFVNNATAAVLAWLAARGTISEDVGETGVGEVEWTTALTSFAVTAVFLFFFYRFRKKPEEFPAA